MKMLKKVKQSTMCRRCIQEGDITWHKWGWRVCVSYPRGGRNSANICNAHVRLSLRELIR